MVIAEIVDLEVGGLEGTYITSRDLLIETSGCFYMRGNLKRGGNPK